MNQHNAKKLFGLVGYPVKHSYSAFMHNAAFAHLNMDACYDLFEVQPQDLESFFKTTIHEKHIKGLNVTVPYKEKVCEYLDIIGGMDVKVIGAVNTVCVSSDGSLVGYNTDAAGFAMDLKNLNVSVKDKKVILLGAGGGAKAIAAAIAHLWPCEFSVFDIDGRKSALLARNIALLGVNVKIASSIEDLGIEGADILINATPIGMKQDDPLLIRPDWLHRELFVYDLIYNPSETKLLQSAKEAGCRFANGLGMLLYQGSLSFTHWTHKRAPVEIMRQALLGANQCLK
ncbi:MAG: shikimate dehydrogenase [Candidatus Omnitrophota bacterium]